MANILFNSQLIVNQDFLLLLEVFIKKKHNCLLVGKYQKSDFHYTDKNFNVINLNFEEDDNDKLILYELSKFYDYGITYNNKDFVANCNSKFKIGFLNACFELIPCNYIEDRFDQRVYKNKIEQIYFKSIFSIINYIDIFSQI